MSSLNKIDWHTLETLELSEISEHHYLPINLLASVDAQLNFVQNRISALENEWVCTLTAQWGDVYRRYGVPCSYNGSFLPETSNYTPSCAVQIYRHWGSVDVYAAASSLSYASGFVSQWELEADEYVQFDNGDSCTSLTRVSKVVDDIYSTIVRHIGAYWQRIALLRLIRRTVFNFRSDLLKKLPTLTAYISIVVSQATWFVCHGFHPPAQFAKGN